MRKQIFSDQAKFPEYPKKKSFLCFLGAGAARTPITAREVVRYTRMGTAIISCDGAGML